MMVRLSSPAPAPAQNLAFDRRDPRIDMLRGLSLMMVFINHIPLNAFTFLTIRPFSFSDAAEIFVFLAGYSAWMRYPAIIRHEGWSAGMVRLGRRCVTIWSAHALLLLGTVLLVLVRYRLTGRLSAELAPLMGDGLDGLVRGLTLATLPAYLDILPLYILLLAALPLLIVSLRRSISLTLLASLILYGAAASQHWNLPNVIDPRSAASVWTFNPLMWQILFVLGAIIAEGRCRGWTWLAASNPVLRIACLVVLIYGFMALNPMHRWPVLAENLLPPSLLGNGWKVNEAPWRVVSALAVLYLLLTAESFKRFGELVPGRVLSACGRHSLVVFSAGSLLALMGRFAYADLGVSPLLQLAVNGIGLGAQISLALWLDQRRCDRRATGAKGWVGQERRA